MNLQFLLSCFYFFLPAYFTNMIPPLMRSFGFFKCLDKPVDSGKNFRGEPFLGSHKTWRGVVGGILVGILTVSLQAWLYQFPLIKEISFFNYREINILLFGFLISGGAIFGDLFFAFIKRRLKLSPGAPFLPFDQTNYVLGAALFLTPYLLACSSPMINWWGVWLTIFVLTFFLHAVFNRLGYELGLNKAKW